MWFGSWRWASCRRSSSMRASARMRRRMGCAMRFRSASHHETPDPCVRPASRTVADPPDLRSRDGLLNVDLAIHNHREADGSIRYCYTLSDGTQAPTLRLHPGDQLVLHLTNALTDVGAKPAAGHGPMSRVSSGANRSPCSGGAMTALTTNLHFHGMTVPSVCHQDDVLKTLIQPGGCWARSNIASAFRMTNRRGFTGITRTSTASVPWKSRAARPAP